MKSASPLPFLSGVYSTGPGLVPLSKNGLPDNRIFDIDQDYADYISNKKRCRSDLSLYFRTHDFDPLTESVACTRVAKELARSYTGEFEYTENEKGSKLHCKITNEVITWHDNVLTSGTYQSVFDAISNQVQEDLAVFQVKGGLDWLAAIHLCSPNHWDPRDKIGRPFPEIHKPVPAMERTVSQYKPMLESVITRGPFARYAWGVDTDNELNHHPAGPNKAPVEKSSDYFVRMERQHLVGLPEVNAFLFTIRTYFFDVDLLNAEERQALASAIRSMTPASLAYKRMDGFLDDLLSKLSSE